MNKWRLQKASSACQGANDRKSALVSGQYSQVNYNKSDILQMFCVGARPLDDIKLDRS